MDWAVPGSSTGSRGSIPAPTCVSTVLATPGPTSGLLVGRRARWTSGPKVGKIQLMGSKRCPFCAERIRIEAVVCRHCGRELPSESTGGPPPRGHWWPLPVAIALLVTGGGAGAAILLAQHHDNTKTYYIPSEAMDPTLRVGDRVVVDLDERSPKRGAIIVFTNPNPSLGGTAGKGDCGQNECFIKRVIGLPGETVECRGGYVYIDGRKLAEPYLNASIQAHGRDTRSCGPFHVPQGRLFVMGDNRPDSNDSRYGLGYIPVQDIVGTVVKVVRGSG
jgi:signal peptidase I